MKKRNFILVKLISILIVVVSLYACNNKSDTITMATEAGFAPYEYYEDNEIVGVDIEIAKQIASYLGKELVIKDIAFDSLINELNSGKADFVSAGMSITEDRLKNVDFSVEYATSKQVIIVKKGYNKINSLDDLKDKTISVQLGSVADSWASKKYPNATVKSQKKFLAGAEDVKTGKSDCLIMDSLPAEEMVKNNTDLEILNLDVFTDKYAIAVKKGNTELLDSINTVLNRLIEEGRIEEYIIKYSS